VRTHELKTWPAFFAAVWRGEKTAEIRLDDRDFAKGDRMTLREYAPGEGIYTGMEIDAQITHVTGPKVGAKFGLRPGFAMLSFRVITKRDSHQEPALSGLRSQG
jgi:hypothetical protein